jgi:3-hydroxyacyl-[acyl-carrier-protein] dehydratase
MPPASCHVRCFKRWHALIKGRQLKRDAFVQSESITLNFASDHPVFAGHFPGKPMVPGVLLLDAALHAAQAGINREQGTAWRCQIGSAKFLSPVLPGETLVISCTPTSSGHTRFDISGQGRQVATGTFTFESSP